MSDDSQSQISDAESQPSGDSESEILMHSEDESSVTSQVESQDGGDDQGGDSEGDVDSDEQGGDSEGDVDSDELDDGDGEDAVMGNVNANQPGYGTFADIVYPELAARSTREVFLMTLAQAPADCTKESVSAMIIDAFANNGEAAIEKWVCAKEPHKNGGHHFHMAIKLDRQKRWLRVRTHISETYGLQIHFADKKKEPSEGSLYDGAYMYTIKGGDFIVSENHPRVDRGGQKDGKLQNVDFIKLVVQMGLRTVLEVKAAAKRNADSQHESLKVFLANKGEKRVCELLIMAWDIEEAPAKLARLQLDRIQILRDAEKSPCTCEEPSQWEYLALEILRLNKIPVDTYTQSVLAALTLGRGKFRNILHIGSTNRGKTFLVKPLKVIYSAFENPSRASFNWLGVDLAEIIILNDFRWGKDVLPWEQLLNLLEGETVKFEAPKNQYAHDIKLTHDTPIFATGRSQIEFKGGVVEAEQENKMMRTRWKVIEFTHEFTEDAQIECKPCKHCYASFLFCVNADDFEVITLADFMAIGN